MRASPLKLALATLGSTLPLLAQAHPGHDFGSSITAGLLHPLTGMDHLLAMLAVGLWAAQLGGVLRWMVPLSFVICMFGGACLGFAGVALPGVEYFIALSVVALGLFITTGARLSALLCITTSGGFALFHGYAHAVEGGAFHGASYVCGMLLSTLLLHVVGVVVGMALLRHAGSAPLRWSGAAIGVCGAALLIN